MSRFAPVASLCSALIIVAFLSLFIFTPASANGDEEQLAETLVTKASDSKEWKDAASKVKGLPEETQVKVAQQMVDKIVADATKAINLLDTLQRLGATAGKDPIGKALGGAIKKVFGTLAGILRDSTSNPGKLQLQAQLIKIGIEDNQALGIVTNLEERIYNERIAANEERQKKEEQKEQDQKKSAGNSVSFDANSQALTFSGDTFIPSDLADTDPIVGATLELPVFTFDGITPEGDYAFIPIGDGAFMVRKGSDVFLSGLIPFITFVDNQFIAIPTDLVLSGVGVDSIFYGELQGLSSDYIAAVVETMTEDLYLNAFIIQLVPAVDFLTATDAWNQSADTGIFNGAGPATYAAPEPETMILIGIGTIVMALTARVRQKRFDSPPLA